MLFFHLLYGTVKKMKNNQYTVDVQNNTLPRADQYFSDAVTCDSNVSSSQTQQK